MLGKLTLIRRALVKHILAHKDHHSFTVKAFLEQSDESRGVTVCLSLRSEAWSFLY